MRHSLADAWFAVILTGVALISLIPALLVLAALVLFMRWLWLV